MAENWFYLAGEQRIRMLFKNVMFPIHFRLGGKRTKETAEFRNGRRRIGMRLIRRAATASVAFRRATVRSAGASTVSGTGPLSAGAPHGRVSSVATRRRIVSLEGCVVGPGFPHRIEVNEAMLLKLLEGLEHTSRSAKTAGEDDVALFRVPDAAPILHVPVDAVDQLAGEGHVAIVAGVNLQVLGQSQVTSANQLLGGFALRY